MYDNLDQLPEKIPTPRDQWLDDFRRGPMTIIVWVLAALLCTWLLTQRHSSGHLLGVASGAESEIRVMSDGVLQEVLVEPFQAVEAGEILALLDSARFDARLATSKARLESLRSALRAAEIRLPSSSAREDREWNADGREETGLRLDVVELGVKLEEDRVEQQRLALQIDRMSALHESGIISAAELDELKLTQQGVEQRIRETEKLLAEARQSLEASTRRRTRLLLERPRAAPADDLELEAMRLEAQAVQFELQELELARRDLVLRAPFGGKVQAILARPGQTVLAGEPLLRLVGLRADRVTVYLPEALAYGVAENRRILVAPQQAPKQVFETSIERLSSSVEMLPQRLWRSANQPEYGRPALLAPLPELQLLPGQIVTARLER